MDDLPATFSFLSRYLSSLPGEIGADAASRVIVGDFFTHQAPGNGYSIIYDYTFSG